MFPEQDDERYSPTMTTLGVCTYNSHSSQFQTLRLMKGSCEKIRNQFCAALFPLMIVLFYVDNFEAIF